MVLDFVRGLILWPVKTLVGYVVSLYKHSKFLFKVGFDQPLLPGIYLFAVNTLARVYPFREMMKVGVTGVTDYITGEGYKLSSLWYSTPVSNYALRRSGSRYRLCLSR